MDGDESAKQEGRKMHLKRKHRRLQHRRGMSGQHVDSMATCSQRSSETARQRGQVGVDKRPSARLFPAGAVDAPEREAK
eukprot:1144866-Pelagomonas_calceolata.AAC.2